VNTARPTYHYRSFFWPAVLILIGVVALLANTGQVSADRLYSLFTLWPLILVVIGLELIVRRTLRGVVGDVAAVLVILLAIVGAAAYVAASPSASSTPFETSADVGSVESASVEIDAGAAQVTVSGDTNLGSTLYKVHLDYSGPKPEVSFDRESGKLVISQPSSSFLNFQNRRFVLDLLLNPSVRWTISQNTGAATSTYRLQNLHVAGLSLDTGASRDDITLGPPSGTVQVQVNGGALTVFVHRPAGAEASITVSGGAVSLNVDGRGLHGIGDLSYQSPGFEGASDAYKIEINGGACTVTLDTSKPSD
jgi:hypothetical protein